MSNMLHARLLTKRGQEKETNDRLNGMSSIAYIALLGTHANLAMLTSLRMLWVSVVDSGTPTHSCQLSVYTHPATTSRCQDFIKNNQIQHSPSTTHANRVRDDLKFHMHASIHDSTVGTMALMSRRERSWSMNFFRSSLQLSLKVPGPCTVHPLPILTTSSRVI